MHQGFSLNVLYLKDNCKNCTSSTLAYDTSRISSFAGFKEIMGIHMNS